jgi:hypothetical protein
MATPYFPDEAIAVLRQARWDASARPSLELLSGTFLWWDEDYLEFIGTCRDKGCLSYWEPLLYRDSLIRGEPKEEYRHAWEELRKLAPEWPGFRPERQSELLLPELLLALEEEYGSS